jgi:uncharacterized protein YdhG (YjbR/CyaY superfamily)
MATDPPPDVDAYIAAAPPEARPTLEELRSVIRSAVPGVEEGISWGVPFYRHHGALAGFAAYARHVSFGLAAALDAEDRRVLEDAGYRTGKKTVQIGFDQDVPAAAVSRMLAARARANETGPEAP